MDQRRDCSVEDCERPSSVKGWCRYHYTRWHRTGDPLTPLVRRRRDDPERPSCEVAECDKPMLAKGLCNAHYLQLRNHGRLVKPCKGCGKALSGRGSHEWCGPECRPLCTVDECDSPALTQADTLCLSHAAQLHKTGRVQPFKFRHAQPGPCLVCGVDNPEYRLRTFCSFAHYQQWLRHGGPPPATKDCLSCGEPIDLTTGTKSGARRPSTIVFCKPCGNRRTKYDGTTVRTLAERDGTNCKLCELPIDMDLRRNHPGGMLCASVDHIVPQSKGGTHDPTNLQLAHLMCNLLKSDRVEITAT